MSTTLLLLSLSVFVLAMIGMAAGVILSNRRLKGSCGGLAGRQDDNGNSLCEMCTDPSPECSGTVGLSSSTPKPSISEEG